MTLGQRVIITILLHRHGIRSRGDDNHFSHQSGNRSRDDDSDDVEGKTEKPNPLSQQPMADNYSTLGLSTCRHLACGKRQRNSNRSAKSATETVQSKVE